MRLDAKHIACIILLSVIAGFTLPVSAGECLHPERAIGVARTVEIDATAGPIFGAYTKQVHEPSFLQPKEVVLTFDDGPLPAITKSILDTLDKYCTKATFFAVGKMALDAPSTTKEILARGHTLGSHTYTHPYNLGRMNLEKAKDEIERGLAAVATAAGVPIAPFFRFTGLADSAALLGYLQTRGLATFTVDVVSNDSYISDEQRLIDHTLKEIGEARGGIVLFHDIKLATARALPNILAALKSRGYSVVHMTAKATAVPLSPLMSELAPKVAHAQNSAKTSVSLHAGFEPDDGKTEGALEVTSIAPEPRDRTPPAKEELKKQPATPKAAAIKASTVNTSGTPTSGTKTPVAKPLAGQSKDFWPYVRPRAAAPTNNWTTDVEEVQPDAAPPVLVNTEEPESTWDAEITERPTPPGQFSRAKK